ncbi:MAG: hypothetical protein KJ970_08905 [Candidatus Eisenbacteria bacterium]|uniref:Uncharacterized protein n=1 Tax=Eiseniibacteriota bacterium TaxID=2212470 RepID=A0A948RUC2_UNCEI|nr:hypothetical protein [Candidatus Eisenbacteria bacterium]MBU1947766.1 hypothetical protein [Candidatus Eisenbacteria bacterium]MBU2691035.1 hypothetical protein [Candidatus Eisenbacteria bacterium]
METWRRSSHVPRPSQFRRRVHFSHFLPVLFLGLAHLLLEQTGWGTGSLSGGPGNLILNVGLLVLALAMSWGFALSLYGWVTSAVARLEQIASSTPGHPSPSDWKPVDWELDRVAHRVLSLMTQNRRGMEALEEVDAVRDQATELLKGWGDPILVGGPGPNDSPARFWRKVRHVLVENMSDVARRSEVLAERVTRCKIRSAELAQGLSESTIQTESLFLEMSQAAVQQTRNRNAGENSSLKEASEGLISWSKEAADALDPAAVERLTAWREWILHCLRESRHADEPYPHGAQGQLEAVSRRLESLVRHCESLGQDVETCHVLALEIHGALPQVQVRSETQEKS